MKVNFVKSIIALAVSGLIAYGFYSFHSTESKGVLVIGSFLFLAITLLFSIGISFNLSRTVALVRTVSIIFFFISLVSNLVFIYINFNMPLYIIINGILFLIYVLVAYSISQSKQ
ncbi:hypothetical protein [Pseudopedobacter beijingensis]|uniref:Uncharacterized protein n=1 Tax=Pseudopedobacter beijingensis TaxID=1207056 RepID=A0ABW4I7I1_9SPHI